MENVILIVLLTAAVAVGIWYTIRHFKGEGGCCGGGSYRPRKKKLSHVTGEKTFRVEGMHCEHCKVRWRRPSTTSTARRAVPTGKRAF